MNAQVAAAALCTTTLDSNTQSSDNTTMNGMEIPSAQSQIGESQTICLPGVTIHVKIILLYF